MVDAATWSRGRLMVVPRCPACGSEHRADRVFERRDDDVSMPDLWRMMRCLDCGSLWLDPRPDEASLPRAYEDYYTHNAEVEDAPDRGAGGFGWRLIRGYLNRRFGMRRAPASPSGFLVFSLIEPWRLKLDYYGRHLSRGRFPHPGTVLDIGCGNGAFLGRAKEMGWSVTGCEPDAKAVSTCRALGLDVIQGDAFDTRFNEQAFDVVTLSHVIEHVVNPLALIRRVHDLLRPDGVFWMALPNPDSVGLRIFESGWSGLHVPYHLCIPSREVIRSWLGQSGFVDVTFVRRGAHVRRLWNISKRICERQALPQPSLIRRQVCRYVADILATIGSRRAEETVVIARKDGA